MSATRRRPGGHRSRRRPSTSGSPRWAPRPCTARARRLRWSGRSPGLAGHAPRRSRAAEGTATRFSAAARCCRPMLIRRVTRAEPTFGRTAGAADPSLVTWRPGCASRWRARVASRWARRPLEGGTRLGAGQPGAKNVEGGPIGARARQNVPYAVGRGDRRVGHEFVGVVYDARPEARARRRRRAVERCGWMPPVGCAIDRGTARREASGERQGAGWAGTPSAHAVTPPAGSRRQPGTPPARGVARRSAGRAADTAAHPGPPARTPARG